jgi:hypothetical protein
LDLADFSIERDAGRGPLIEGGDSDAEPGLFALAAGELGIFGFEAGFSGPDFLIQKGGFGGLRPEKPPFVGDEGFGALEFGDGPRTEPGEPPLAKEGEFFWIFVAEQRADALVSGAGIAAVLEPGFAALFFAGGGDGSAGTGSVDAGLFGPGIFARLIRIRTHGDSLHE